MRNHSSELAAWLVILAVVAFLVYANVRRSNGAAEDPIKDVRITLSGKETIGMKSLQRSLPGSQWGDANTQLIAAMDSSAATPEDSFRVAIVVGDVLGKDQALARLDTLSRRPISSELADDIASLRTIYTAGADSLDPAARERLIQRHDFFAPVALSYGADPKSEARKTVEQAAVRTLILVSAIGGALFLLVAASLAVLVVAVVLYRKGKIRRAYESDALAPPAYLEAFALYLTAFVAFGFLARQFGLVSLNWNWLAVLLIPLAMSWTMRRGASAVECRKAFGWHRGQGWLREIAAGIGGYLAGLALIAVGLAITFMLIKLTGAAPQHPITQMLKGDRWHVLALYGVACVFAPLLEETMFRGALFHHMRRRHRWLISALVVGSIFAIIHPQGWAAVPALVMIAVVLAAVREWRGTIIAPMAAHACNNFIVLTLALLLLR